MPLERPTLAQLVDDVRADLKARFSIFGAILRRSFLNICATVWAGAVHLLYGFLAWLAQQLFADTAEREYLLRIASLYGITPTPATFAAGTVTLTGVDTTLIPSGTVLVRDDEATYTTTAAGTITGGTVSVPVTADLAGLACLSKYHFARAFKESFQTTPHQYVLKCRIEHASSLLRNTDFPISIIAEQCGFSSASRFSKVFSNLQGISPNRYRYRLMD